METGLVMIHARFANDGSVREIGECPAGVTPQDWFNVLSRYPDKNYEALSGGRGLFRIAPAVLEEVKAHLVASGK